MNTGDNYRWYRAVLLIPSPHHHPHLAVAAEETERRQIKPPSLCEVGLKDQCIYF